MKSVIINLKYLIFRSASASEGGSLEERQREGGMEDGKSRAVASVLSASATLKPALTKAQTAFYLFIFSRTLLFSESISELFVQDLVHIYSFSFCTSRFRFSIGLCHLSPISKLHLQPSALAPERLRALVIRCEACLTLTDKPALTMPVPAA